MLEKYVLALFIVMDDFTGGRHASQQTPATTLSDSVSVKSDQQISVYYPAPVHVYPRRIQRLDICYT